MSNVILLKPATVPQLLGRIKSGLEELDRTLEQSDQRSIALGHDIKALKEQEPKQWLEFVRDYCGLGETCAYELLSIAEGQKTDAEVRERGRESMRVSRQHACVRNVAESETDEVEDDDPYVKEFKSTTERNTHAIMSFVDEGFRAAFDCRKRMADCVPNKEMASEVRRLIATWTKIADDVETLLG